MLQNTTSINEIVEHHPRVKTSLDLGALYTFSEMSGESLLLHDTLQ